MSDHDKFVQFWTGMKKFAELMLDAAEVAEGRPLSPQSFGDQTETDFEELVRRRSELERHHQDAVFCEMRLPDYAGSLWTFPGKGTAPPKRMNLTVVK